MADTMNSSALNGSLAMIDGFGGTVRVVADSARGQLHESLAPFSTVPAMAPAARTVDLLAGTSLSCSGRLVESACGATVWFIRHAFTLTIGDLTGPRGAFAQLVEDLTAIRDAFETRRNAERPAPAQAAPPVAGEAVS